ncbi:MAG: hypothetical protein AB7K24_08865 [Gemmataceae bacterium]
MKKAFDHIGVWTTEQQEGERWVPETEVWVTNPRKHPGRIEFLRPKQPPQISRDQPGLWKLWNYPHIAYRVDSLAQAIEGKELVYGPFEPGGPFVIVAFVLEHGAVIEYLEYRDLNHWFGEANPPGWEPEPW